MLYDNEAAKENRMDTELLCQNPRREHLSMLLLSTDDTDGLTIEHSSISSFQHDNRTAPMARIGISHFFGRQAGPKIINGVRESSAVT